MTVFKIGGGILDSEKALNKVLKYIKRYGGKKIIVHGGGKKLNLIFQKIGMKSKFKKGRRITTRKNIKIVERVLSGEINKMLVEKLAKLGLNPFGFSCKDGFAVTGRRMKGYGYVGVPLRVNVNLLSRILEKHTPVISSIGSDKTGTTLNMNADEVAKILAIKLKAKKLIFFTETAGVLDTNNRTIKILNRKSFSNYIKKNMITGGMQLKVMEALSTLKKGIEEVLILNENLEGTKITL